MLFMTHNIPSYLHNYITHITYVLQVHRIHIRTFLLKLTKNFNNRIIICTFAFCNKYYIYSNTYMHSNMDESTYVRTYTLLKDT